MGEIYNSIRKLATGYVRRSVSLDDFRVEFAGLYFRARQAKHERDANLLAGRIVGPLSEYGRGHRSEESLRETVLAAIGPIEELYPVATRPSEGRFQLVSVIYHQCPFGSANNNNVVIIPPPFQLPVECSSHWVRGVR